MIQSPNELEGVRLAGGYELGRCLGSEQDAAFFETAFQGLPAVLELLPEDMTAGDERLALWRETAALSHPHLVTMVDCGRTEVEGTPFLYAVFEQPDDSLAGVTGNGPLSAAETRDILAAVAEALRYIHQRDLVHSAVDAGHIVAVGDRIKLASDCLRHAGEGGAQPPDDVRALGALVYELLTARRLAAGEVPDVSGISQPLAAVIAHTVEPDAERRWTAAEIGAALNPPPRVEPAAPAPVPEEKPAQPMESARPVRPPAPPLPAFALPPEQVVPPPAPPRSALTLTRRSPALPLLLCAVGAVVVAIVLAVTGRSAPEEVAAGAGPAQGTPAVAAAIPARAAAPAVSTPVPAPTAKPVPPARPSAAHPRGTWRVIAYTYNRRDQAAHKAAAINRRIPGFEAGVFAPRGADRPPYFVALGGPMSRDAAVTVRKKARSRGLPGDTFVRSY
jgi:eukaryotic-like serine/threonine-protein kinase